MPENPNQTRIKAQAKIDENFETNKVQMGTTLLEGIVFMKKEIKRIESDIEKSEKTLEELDAIDNLADLAEFNRSLNTRPWTK